MKMFATFVLVLAVALGLFGVGRVLYQLHQYVDKSANCKKAGGRWLYTDAVCVRELRPMKSIHQARAMA